MNVPLFPATRAAGWLRRWCGAAGVAAVLGLAGCGHARSVEKPTSGDEAASKAANATPPSDRHPAHAAGASTGGSTGDATSGEKKTDSSSGIPLSTSPAGQLKDGAAKDIQDRLVSLGFLGDGNRSGELDGHTEAALRKFQKSRDLAATGVPDTETVRKLGLDPGKIFRSAH
jgi:hypothetical protein